MTVVLIAHAKIEKFENPETVPYDRYSSRLHKLASALVQEWADEVLFATYKVHTVKVDEGSTRPSTTAFPPASGSSAPSSGRARRQEPLGVCPKRSRWTTASSRVRARRGTLRRRRLHLPPPPTTPALIHARYAVVHPSIRPSPIAKELTHGQSEQL